MEIEEILKNRIEAYEIGSTPKREDKIASLRDKIILILDEHGIKKEDGTPDVVEWEGQKVDPEYEQSVSEMREEIRNLASQRSDKVSQEGEDVLPVLKKLQEFAKTEEGKADGSIQTEISRLIEENNAEIQKLRESQRDQVRIREIKREIEEAKKELEEIKEEIEVKKNFNYDAESIRRTTLNVRIYHRENELRGILTRNPNADTINPEVVRNMEKHSNIVRELEEIQKVKGENVKSEIKPVKEETMESVLKTEEVSKKESSSDEKKPIEDASKTAKKTTEDTSKADEKPIAEVSATVNPEEEKKEEETSKEEQKKEETKKTENSKDSNKVYKVGKLRSAILNWIKKRLAKAKPNGFWSKFLSGAESAILLGAKEETLAIAEPQNSKTTEKATKKTTEKTTKNSEESIIEDIDDDSAYLGGEQDAIWAKTQVENVRQGVDEESLISIIVSKAYEKTLKKREGKTDKELAELNKENNVFEVLPGEENAFQNLLYDEIAGIVLTSAKKQGISMREKFGKERKIEDIFKDLEKKYLQEKTNRVSEQKSSDKTNEEESHEVSKTGTDR